MTDNLQTLADEILDRNDERFPGWEHNIASDETERQIYWTNALAGEVGELCNASKKHHRFLRGFDGRYLTDEQYQAAAADELADIFIYMILYTRVLDIDLSEAIRRKIEEIHSVRFPNE